jgi:hypothetical protein
MMNFEGKAQVDLIPIQTENGRGYYRIDGILRSEDEILKLLAETTPARGHDGWSVGFIS